MIAEPTAGPIVVCLARELERMIPGYLENRWLDADALADALRRGDYADVRLIGRTMQGTAEVYGLPHLARLGEALAGAGRERAADRIGRRIDELRAYLRRLKVIYQ
jgi:hypothetical protein